MYISLTFCFQAVAAVQPGGSIVYSTCTFLMEENEDIVSWALSHFDCLTLVSQVSVSGTASSF